MIVSDFAVSRSTTVFVLLLLIFIAGIICYNAIPREEMPQVEVPFVTVTTTYSGVSPSDMETLVTIPVERELVGLTGIREMTSTSVEGVSAITIEFEPDIVIEDALQKVRDQVELARSDLPEDAEDPLVKEVNISDSPIMYVALTGDVGLPLLSRVAEDYEEKIEAIKGVLEVEVIGDIEREIQIVIDPERLNQYGIPLSSLVSLLQLENVNTPGGVMDFGEAKFLMRVPGEFTDPDELKSLVVKRGQTGVVYLRDIAEIRDGFKEVASISRVDGAPSVTLNISKRSGENIIGVTDAVHELIAENRNYLPAGVEILVTVDQSNEIRDQVTQLENNILSGLVLVLAVIFLFMGFSNAVFVSMAIPIAFLITFIVFAMIGMTLNTIVLFSLTLALGMLVDNGIVVVENIYRHAQRGLPPAEAARTGAGEVAMPVIASTVTTIAAFAPLFFWPTMMGKMMQFLPRTLTIILLASLFVGLVVNPALASVFSRARKQKIPSKYSPGRLVLSGYEWILKFCLHWRIATLTTAVMSLIVITAIFISGAQVIFLPETQPFSADIVVTCAEGTSLETSDQIVRQVEKIIEPQTEYIEYVTANVGVGGQGRGMPGRGNPAGSSHKGRVTMRFPPFGQYEKEPSKILDEIRPELETITGAEVQISEFTHGPPTSGAAVNLELSGDNYQELAQIRQDIRRAIQGVPGLVGLRDDLDKGKPEVRVAVDRERAWMTGLNTQTVGLSVRAAIDGRKAGEYREGEDEYDVMVRFPDSFKEDISNIESMSFINDEGAPIPFSAVAKIEQGAGLGTIKHVDRKRTIVISGDAEGRPSTAVIADVKDILRDFPLPAGYFITFSGEDEDMAETQNFLGIAFFVGLFLIALVLITQFNSIIQPLIILSSVILSLAGVFLGLTIFDMPFGAFMTGLGCISLAGIVVNNAIVLVDFINQERRRGAAVTEAVIQAGLTRFRPVMLTAVTTILGLIPMAIGVSFDFRNFEWAVGGPTSQYWGSMAVAICFGLGFSTLLTLIVVPVSYSLSDSFAQAMASEPGKESVSEPAIVLEPVVK